MVTCQDFPPDLIEHWTSDKPIIYYYFLGFGGICLVIIWSLLIPRIKEMYQHAKQERDKRQTIFISRAYVACLLFLSFPVCASVLKYIIFLAPIAAYSVEFIIACYESAVLLSFTTLIIMYLGSVNIVNAFDGSTPTKFCAAPPLACCFRPCVKAATVSQSTFTKIYFIILQYCVLAPLFQFALLVRGYKGAGFMYQILNLGKAASVLLCFYGLFALLIATHELLHKHGIHGKFWCLKGLILIMLIPEVAIEYIEPLPGQMDGYNHYVMVEAYSAMTSLVCLTPLVLAFCQFFTPSDAYCAMHNAEKKDHTASDELIGTGYSQLDAHIHNSLVQSSIPMVVPETGFEKPLVSKLHESSGNYSHLKRTMTF